MSRYLSCHLYDHLAHDLHRFTFSSFTHCQCLIHPHPYDYSCIFRGDGNFLKARQEAKKGELDEQLREYINEWRKQRSKEEEELQRLKEKQTKR